MNVILVDDEALALNGLAAAVTKVLPEANIRSFFAAQEAMEYARETPVDIAFLDIHMRVMDGLAMARKLIEWYPRVNIVFCTGFSDYAIEAIGMYCSAYLMKPITEEKVREAVEKLRYPLEERRQGVTVQCFGNFEVFFNGVPIRFKHSKTKELLAYLIDRNGTDCTNREITAMIFEEDDKSSYFDHLRVDLLHTFQDLGVPEVIRRGWGTLGVERSLVKCDYYDYLDGKGASYNGEYMQQYSWAEYTHGGLT